MRLTALTISIVILFAALGLAASDVPLGAEGSGPSAARPTGWRGDWSGRYPGATPPTSWERKRAGNSYATKGIAWMAPLPQSGVSIPVIVGDRIYVTCEVDDVVCLDKQTGRLLWIRSNPEFEALTDAERQANPIYAEKLAPLAQQLEKGNADVVAALNAQLPTAATALSAQPSPAIVRKRDIEKQIENQQLAIDKKTFARYWAQAVFGFAGPTPVTDGKRIYVFFTTGVVACYDLDGNRQWIARCPGGGSEHGNFASPLLCDGKLVVWANEMRGYDAETGKLLWANPAKANNSYGSLFLLKSGDEKVAAFQSGFFTRLSDGKAIWTGNVLGDSVCTPIVEGDTVYGWVGYPRNNHEKLGFKAFRGPATTEGAWPKAERMFTMDWAADQLPIDKKKNPFDREFVCSPLYVDGVIYQLTEGGGLFANDAATGETIYRKVLPLKPRTEYWNWAGCSASPTLAGKYIYLMDNQGTTIIIKPGKEYVEVATNTIEESRDGKTQEQNVSTPIFEGSRMYYRTPGYLYCIGEK